MINMQPCVLNKGNESPLSGRAFEERLSENRKRVYSVALRMLGNRTDAEDITQEALARAWSGRAGFDPTRSFSTWIVRIVTNLCIDQLRKRRSRPSVSLDAPLNIDQDSERSAFELPDLSHNPERLLLSSVLDEKLQKGIESLPAEYDRTVRLLGQGYSYEEIAAMLHCPLGTIRSRIHRARAHLRRVMEG
jgi:RNA polymerase sigma-70 factor (ECF subfamily)